MTASTDQGLADDEFPFTVLPTWPEDDHTSDGYVWAGELPDGWNAVYSWGSQGWDLGDPPYEVVAHFDDIPSASSTAWPTTSKVTSPSVPSTPARPVTPRPTKSP